MKKLLVVKADVTFNIGHMADLSTVKGHKDYEEFKELLSKLEEAKALFEKELCIALGISEDDFQLTSFALSEEDIEEDKGE